MKSTPRHTSAESALGIRDLNILDNYIYIFVNTYIGIDKCIWFGCTPYLDVTPPTPHPIRLTPTTCLWFGVFLTRDFNNIRHRRYRHAAYTRRSCTYLATYSFDVPDRRKQRPRNGAMYVCRLHAHRALYSWMYILLCTLRFEIPKPIKHTFTIGRPRAERKFPLLG